MANQRSEPPDLVLMLIQGVVGLLAALFVFAGAFAMVYPGSLFTDAPIAARCWRTATANGACMGIDTIRFKIKIALGLALTAVVVIAWEARRRQRRSEHP